MLLAVSLTFGIDLIFHKKIASKTRWEVTKKVDNLIIGIFDSALRIYLCVNTGISFLLCDIVLCLKVFMKVGATVFIRVPDGAGVLCMCE